MPRLTMKLLGFWLLPSFLWALVTPQKGTHLSDQELCEEDEPTLHLYNISTRQKELVDLNGDEKVSCLLYPEKMLRCTMLGNLTRGSQLSASVIFLDEEWKASTIPECSEAIQPSEEPGEAKPFIVCRVDHHFSYLTVLLNVSGQDKPALHCHKFSYAMLEVLSPPPNISAVVREGLLLVSWGLPYSFYSKEAECFHYQLEVNQQEKEIIKGKNHLKMPVDPAADNAVRMRTRKHPNCLGPEEWSAWSDTIALLPGSRFNLNYVVIGSIVLGTPMIILALLLLLRRPRVSKVLFPQIPQPPKKYQHFLNRPTSCSFPPVVQTAYEVNITVVEDTQSSNDELKRDL